MIKKEKIYEAQIRRSPVSNVKKLTKIEARSGQVVVDKIPINANESIFMVLNFDLPEIRGFRLWGNGFELKPLLEMLDLQKG